MILWKPLVSLAAFAGLACTDIGDSAFMSTELDVPSGPLSFEAHIKPILAGAGCFGCHPSGGGEAGFDATTPESIRRGGQSGFAGVVPCDPSDSYLYWRVKWCEMPKVGECLNELEVAIIERWIRQGGGATFDPAICEDAPGIIGAGTPDE